MAGKLLVDHRSWPGPGVTSVSLLQWHADGTGGEQAHSRSMSLLQTAELVARWLTYQERYMLVR